VAVSTAAVTAGAWTHVQVTCRAGHAFTFTINNGTPESIAVAGDLINFSSDTLHLSLGADLNGGSRFTGSLAKVQVVAGEPAT
jgi:hypothetical protein